MLVTVNLSKEVSDYFRGYNLDKVADTLLDMYDITNLPPCTLKRYTDKKINVTNELFIQLYESLGARNKKVSLGRLFEFAYNMDVLSMSRFNELREQDTSIDDPVPKLLSRAYRALSDACRYDNSKELKDITSFVYDYMTIKGGK